MLRKLARSRLASASLISSVLLVLAGMVAFASIPDSAGVIHACYNTAAGTLRVIDSPTQACRPSETAISWNQVGPSGAIGPQGPQGPQGPSGVLGLQVVNTTSAFDTSSYKTVTALCPAGTKVVSGGAGVFWTDSDPTLRPHLLSSFVFPAGTNGWYAEAAAPSSATSRWYVQAQAFCGS
jgi:hypothetical protein